MRSFGEDLALSISLRQLSTMLGAGVSLIGGIKLIAVSHDNIKLKNIFTSIYVLIAKGVQFSVAMSKSSGFFSTLEIATIKAGESRGNLEETLAELSAYLDNTASLKRKIFSTLLYPLITMTFSISLMGFLLIFALPGLLGIFSGINMKLPFLTLVILAIVKCLIHPVTWLLLLFFCTGIFLYLNKKIQKEKELIDRWKWNSVPVFSSLYKKEIWGRFCRGFSTLHASGIPLLQNLILCQGVASNKIFSLKLEIVKSYVKNGLSFAESMEKVKFFPSIITSTLKQGEKGSNIKTAMAKIAQIYEEDLAYSISRLLTFVEPVIMGVVGVVVGILVLSVYLPIYELAANIK